MSSVQQGSSGTKRRGNRPAINRRSWSLCEEEILIVALRDLIAQGLKSDNGFRAGYLNPLEEAMRKEFPGTDLKGNPHINSKIATWKKNYYSLSGIMSRSGVGFNLKGNYLIDVEDSTWEQIIKVDPSARLMRFKSWPNYEVWKEIFGKDRATGEAAEDLLDAFNDIMEETNSVPTATEADPGVGFDATPTEEDADTSMSQSHKADGVQTIREKRRKVSRDVQEMCAILDRIGRNADARMDLLAGRIGYDFDLDKKKKEAFEKLEQMDFLTVSQRFNVCELLSNEVDKLQVFRGLSDAMVPSYIEHLLNNIGM